MPNPKTESQVRQDIAYHLKDGFHWQSIESRLTARGVPDLNGCHAGISIWVEIKIIEGNHFRHPLTPNQRQWIKRRMAAGGRCFVLGSHRHNGGPIKGPPVDKLYLWPGTLVLRPVATPPMHCLDLVLWESQARHDWNDLGRILFS